VSTIQQVERHYTPGDLVAAIREGLQRAGKDVASLTLEDLAPVDEFHVRGREATRELAAQLDLRPGLSVLDVGSGTGGASRFLAATYGCRVIGIDLTAEYCRAATALAQWVKLDALVEYRQANALDLPFPDDRFDVAWTQHVAMNIADKARLYAGIRRVVKPGGAFALYDVLKGPGGDVKYPVPWAREPSISFLVTPDALRRLLEQAGFRIESWRDRTAEGRTWFRSVAERLRAGGAPPLGFHLLIGPEFATMAENMRRNLDEDRIALLEAICRRD
jgi:ubiquinone/menaquinone biosynthesis C-methylase UbiE